MVHVVGWCSIGRKAETNRQQGVQDSWKKVMTTLLPDKIVASYIHQIAGLCKVLMTCYHFLMALKNGALIIKQNLLEVRCSGEPPNMQLEAMQLKMLTQSLPFLLFLHIMHILGL